MSSGNDLQEMEVGTTQSKTAVNDIYNAPETSATPVATPGQEILRGSGWTNSRKQQAR